MYGIMMIMMSIITQHNIPMMKWGKLQGSKSRPLWPGWKTKMSEGLTLSLTCCGNGENREMPMAV